MANGALTPNLKGAIWMLGSAVCFTAMTTLVKSLGADYPASLQTFYRQAAGLVVLAPLIARDWRRAFHATRPGVLVFRAAVGVLGTILSFYAYQKLPLADANALSFTRALWLAPMAFFMLGEKVGPARIAATLVGFAGVLVMLAPSGHQAFNWAQGAALASSFLLATAVVGMKVVTRDHSAFTVLVYAAVLGFVFSTPPALFVWRWPTPVDLALLSLMGVLGVAMQACYIKGIEIGDAAAMAPIDYTRLVFAVALGFVLFHEIPHARTLIGAAIVIASTLFITLREHRQTRRAQGLEAAQA